jgi:hypothetical protein
MFHSKKLKHHLWFSLTLGLACASARAEGFYVLPNSSLSIQPLAIEAQANRMSPVFNYGSFRILKAASSPKYFIATGLGVPQYNIADHPAAAAWELLPEPSCASLRAVALSEVKHVDVKAITVKDAALPLGCAASFEGSCTSRDKRLVVSTRFVGTQRIKKIRDGFFGNENKIDTPFYSGQRILSIQHVESGKKVEYVEHLKDTPGYSSAEKQIVYLPELSIVLLMGLASEQRVPVASCIKLP